MFTAVRVGLSGLVEIDTPARMVRLCDGGFLVWPGVGAFVSSDETFGAIEAIDQAAEAIGDEQGGGRLSLNVPTLAGAVALAQPSMQGRSLRFWLAEYDVATGLMIGTPRKMFEGMIDTIATSSSKGDRSVALEYVDAGERMFATREGNVLSTRFHQTAWPGEKGFDFCTGTSVQVPWGISGPPRGSTGGGGLAGGGIAGFFASLAG